MQYILSEPLISKNKPDPTITADVGLGVGGTATVIGTDTAGEITLTTGLIPVAFSTLCRMTYSIAFPVNKGIATLTAANNKAAALSITGDVFVTCFQANFRIESTIVLPASTTFVWNYHVIGYEN